MARILLMFLGLILLVGGLIFFFARLNVGSVNQTVKSKVSGVLPDKLTGKKAAEFQPKELPAELLLTKSELLDILDTSISAVNKRIDDLARKQQTTPLTNQTQPPPTQTTTTTSSGPKVSYIPIGNTGSGASSTDFVSLSGHEVTIDPAKYPGYKQMVLEANFRIFQGNGLAEVRLFNKTDGGAILGSLVSTTSQDYTTKASGGFTLASGSKTYTVQVKSTTGYSVDLQTTRIRVDF